HSLNEGGGAAGDEVFRSKETQADWRLLVCVLGASLERVLSTAEAAVCYLTIEYREERETWAAELAGSEEIWIL
ncbi:hypothetical protein, partial [Rhizobium ruizarguesonis]|uniref:hypothetical protein n=1 Tax=Rhizobium ruizarguesonis TaxID=2081791 RepID=UPI001A90C560